jgi:hypothetical protein
LTASRHVRFVAAGMSLAESRARVLLMNQSSDGLQVRNEVVKTSQITGGVENAVPLHGHIPCISGRGSDLPFEAVLGGLLL